MVTIFLLVRAKLQPNHLVGLKRRYLQLKFRTVEDLMKAKRYKTHLSDVILTTQQSRLSVCCRDILPAVKKNWEKEKSRAAYDPSLFTSR